MDGTLVYSKTPIGVAEISLRSAQLTMATRRVLIMIDGKRTVDDLSIVVKPGEIAAVIANLESSGLIQRVSHFGALDVPTIYGRDSETGLGGPRPRRSDDRDRVRYAEEVKRRAVRGLNERSAAAESLTSRSRTVARSRVPLSGPRGRAVNIIVLGQMPRRSTLGNCAVAHSCRGNLSRRD